jgi:lipopolysaccharide export LptBFGC system permease protein LptF
MFSREEESRNEIIASYLVSALCPLLGIPLSLYFLVKGRIFHFIGIALISLFMGILWVFVYIRYGNQLDTIPDLLR